MNCILTPQSCDYWLFKVRERQRDPVSVCKCCLVHFTLFWVILEDLQRGSFDMTAVCNYNALFPQKEELIGAAVIDFSLAEYQRDTS